VGLLALDPLRISTNMADLKFTNSTQAIPSAADLAGGFTVKAGPSTDIWSKPPSTIAFNAPILHKTTLLSSFEKARVRITASWTTLYDQGGLILVMNCPDGSRKWVKTGIEFVNGKPHVSTVAKDNWADWSLLSMPSGSQAATIEMTRDAGTLWIYLIEGIRRQPIREVTWVFEEESTTECWIGAYAAKPSTEGEYLEVMFEQLEIELTR